ncbi:hypothetical protein HK405_004664, partial [Cladochytrium tenue]
LIHSLVSNPAATSTIATGTFNTVAHYESVGPPQLELLSVPGLRRLLNRAIQLAAQHNRSALLPALLTLPGADAGADTDLALRAACAAGAVAAVRLLLYEPDVDPAAAHHAALHAACAAGHAAVARLLLDHPRGGGDPAAAADVRAAFLAACGADHAAVARVVLDRVPSAAAFPAALRAALQCAADAGAGQVVDLLLAHPGLALVADRRLAVVCAKRHGHVALAERLALQLPREKSLSKRGYASTSRHGVVIVSAARTPVGSFGKSLAAIPATKLGSIAIRGAIDRASIQPADVEEVLMGNVVSAALGQAPARQAALGAGCPDETEATTVNKVCASGLKAVALAAQSLRLGERRVVVAGGMESMSNAPFYIKRGIKYGNQTLYDSIVHDGLTDAYGQMHMGVCAEETAAEHGFSRADQDAHAVLSYQRAAAAWAAGRFDAEIVPVPLPSRSATPQTVTRDEEFASVNFDKIPALKGAFVKDGTVTAANSSTLNDGASALVLMTEDEAARRGAAPLARILASADAACAPRRFTGQVGVAAICNGGGAATAMVVERL